MSSRIFIGHFLDIGDMCMVVIIVQLEHKNISPLLLLPFSSILPSSPNSITLSTTLSIEVQTNIT